MRISSSKKPSLARLVVAGLMMILSMSMAQELVAINSPAALDDPGLLVAIDYIGRVPLSNYGSLEPIIQSLRAHRPLDLNSELWRAEHPESNSKTALLSC